MTTKRSESIEEMENSHLRCRDKGHRWEFKNDQITAGNKRDIREVSRWWRCETCLTEQEEVFEIPSCDIKARRYHYPDGYLLLPGAFEGRRANVRDIRRAVFHRNGLKF